MKKTPLHRKYSGTFFIFPVFLPLAELLPWLLTLIAALAGMAQYLTRHLFKRPRNRFLLLIVSMLCLLAAGFMIGKRVLTTPSESAGSELVAPQHYSTLQYYAPVPLRKPQAKGVFSLLWKTDTLHENIGKPSISHGLLMVGTASATLDAYELDTGQRVFTLQKHEQVFSTPSVAGDLAFVGEGHHDSPASVLTAFTLPAGTPLWERKFRSHLESYPLIDAPRGRLFMDAGATGLWALAMQDGKSLWWAPIGHSDIPPLLAHERLFAAAQLQENSNGSALFELDPNNGAILHRTKLNGNPMGNLLPANDNGAMLLATAIGEVGITRASDTGWVYGFTQEGAVRWVTTLPAMPLPEGIMLRDRSLVFYTLANGSLIALRPQDGSIAWQVTAGDALQTDATLIEDGATPLVVAITMQGLVTIRKALDGKEIMHFTVATGNSYPLYHEGLLYITTPYDVRAYQVKAP